MADDDLIVGYWSDALSAGLPYNKKALSLAKGKFGPYVWNCSLNWLKSQQFRPNPLYVHRMTRRHFKTKYGLNITAHTSAEDTRKLLGHDWERFFKFAFVRNPWDHAVSDYYWRWRKKAPGRHFSFKEFLHLLSDPQAVDPDGIRPQIITNWSVYTIDDQIVSDFIGKFENLNNDLRHISSKIGVDLVSDIKNLKSNSRDKSSTLRSHYDEESVELVRKIYRKEIEAFNYQLPF